MHTVYAAVYVCMLLAFCFFCFFAFGPSPHFETRRLLLRRYHASRWPLLPTTAHTSKISLVPEAQKWRCMNAPSGRQVFSSRVADLLEKVAYIIMLGASTFCLMLLCGSTLAPLQ